MAARLYYGHSAPAYVDFDVNRKINHDIDNNQHNAVAEDGSVGSVEFGYNAEFITVKVIGATETKILEIRTYLETWAGKTHTFNEIWGTSPNFTVRWWDEKLKYVRNHHDSYTAKIKLRVEAS